MENASLHKLALAGILQELIRVEGAFKDSLLFAETEKKKTVETASKLAVGGMEIAGQISPRQLQSIFTLLEFDGTKKTVPGEALQVLPALPLSLKNIFPVARMAEKDADRALQTQLNRAVSKAKELKQIHEGQDDIETYLESLMLLMQKELWCVPSLPGVSLYDHARCAAALSVCIGDSDKKEENIATLVGGDISGIQRFIYTITSKGAASALRGRSLYLQLLTDAIARYVLRELNLPVTNLLFSGGGHFFILARSDADLKSARTNISRILLTLHSGELYLALEGVSLGEGDFNGKALSEKWKALSQKMRAAKLRKFSELEEDLNSLVFEPRPDEGNREKECAVCGRERRETKRVDGILKCPQCLSFEALGKDLRDAKYLRISHCDGSKRAATMKNDDIEKSLAWFDLRARLYDSAEKMAVDNDALSDVKRSVVYALRDDALEELANEIHTAVGRRFLVNVTPVIKDAAELGHLRERRVEDLPEIGDVKTFEALEAESRGVKRLGVLRMDVDNMGRIISDGLGDRANLARIGNLSFMINLFFEGWAAEVARKHNRIGGADTDSVYSIYSGGDDLFFVGAWDRMPDIALEIRNDLTRFACQHPYIHASAGIALVDGKYPLYQAAEEAHVALEKSKAREEKNSITFLGQTIEWKHFADEVKPHADRLKALMEKRLAPRALVQKLQQYQLQFQEKQEDARSRGEAETKQGEEQVVWGPWNWRAAYFLSKIKVKEDAETEVEQIRNKLGNEKFRAIEWIGLMARWVDLLTR